MKYLNKTNTFDQTVYQLCSQIDDLHEEVEYWRTKYEKEKLEYNNMLNQNMIQAKRDLSNAFQFVFATQTDENDNLIISSKNRKQLANNLK